MFPHIYIESLLIVNHFPRLGHGTIPSLLRNWKEGRDSPKLKEGFFSEREMGKKDCIFLDRV